jgi:TusA-related sulfurtransferase
MNPANDSDSSPDVARSVGECLITSLSERDPEKLASCFHSNIRFRALVPSGLRESIGVQESVAMMLSWFSEAKYLQLLQKEVNLVSHRLHVSYRFREFYADGESEVIEQQAYCNLHSGLIDSITIMCSGHLPEKEDVTFDPVHHRFDAGDLGCGSGLPQEFRKQVSAIPIGNTIDIVTRDPSAKEDLPSLARLLGHQVLSIQSSPEGVIIITVQRGR